MIERSDVVDFLNLFKGCIILDRLHFMNREKNIQGLIDLEISAIERREILLGLVP